MTAGPWLLLRSGAAYDYWSDHSDLEFEDDVVVPLSRITRYLGHTRDPWSVAAHAVLAAKAAKAAREPVHVVLDCLHHDDAEALVGDVPTPVKRIMGTDFTRLEDAAHVAIMHAAHAAGLHHYVVPDPAVYKRFDLVALVAERTVLKAPTPEGRRWGPELSQEDLELADWAGYQVTRAVQGGRNWGPDAVSAYWGLMADLTLEC